MNNRRLKEQITIDYNMCEVSTDKGTVRGLHSEGIYIFRGIEYGRAQRFHEPIEVEPYDGVKEAITFGNSCPELSTTLPEYESEEHPYYTVQSEDCLYLNVYTKEYHRNDLRPVRVFFLDKDFSSSFGVEKLLHNIPDEVLLSDTVIVSINTRLNILGYLDLSEYGQEFSHSGCLGLLDRELALSWVRRNITVFGGDPNNIHIYQNPSSNPATFIERTKEESRLMTDYFLKALGLKCLPANTILQKLLSLRYEELANAALEAEELTSIERNKVLRFSPVIDEIYCPGHPIAITPNGMLRGAKKDSSYIFRGIKYADSKRFRMPSAAKPWKGIKNALIYGPVCSEIQTVQPDDNFTVPHVFYPQHEDCQYLNIWTQSLSNEKKAPVMVWLHGGGFATGSGIEHFAYNGKDLSEYGDVVVVTLNHRLNVLGYLDLSKYGDEYRYSGNVGTADIVEALRWIRHNISAFGGDPNNVTIFGQSGGGGKVAALLQTPSADGLFHRAIIQSGLAHFHKNNADELDITTALLEKLQISKENIHEIDSVPYYKLAEALLDIDPRAPFSFGPHQDDDFYLGDALEVGICEHAKSIPVMVGNVLGEFCQNFVFTAYDGHKNDWTSDQVIELVHSVMGDKAETAMALQTNAYPDKPVVNVLFTDRMFRPCTFDYLKLRAESACENTYGFMFMPEMPVYGGTLPWHNSEIPYVFHNAHCIEPSYQKDFTQQLEDLVASAWINFAKSGNPGFDAYTKNEHNIMYFDVNSQVKSGDEEETLVRFLENTPIKLNNVVRQIEPILFCGGPRIN